jgi:FAD/FMN-containing dehydrogenase
MASVRSTPASVIVTDDAVADLRSRMRGPVLIADDEGYASACQVWNGMIDRRPALIARCAGTADVITAVNFACEHDLLVSVRGGGHSVAGKAICDDGLMIDLSQMKGIRVDPATRTARAEPGVLWGEFDRETQVFGLATTGGVVGTTGIAGLTLGGGVGWLNGKYGLACDNLLSADVVTADGKLLHASATDNADLFWALRGAGHNFGIVTSFEYRLHPVGPMVLGGMLIHPIERIGDLVRFYRDFTASEPDELTTYVGAVTTPDGQLVAALVTCYAGDIDEGERILAPLRLFGPPIADLIGPMPYTAMQSMFDAAFPYGRLSYWKSGMMRQITDEAIAAFAEHAPMVPSPFTAILLEHYHGAYSRADHDSTAFSHRADPYEFVVISNWTDPADSDRQIRWTRDFHAAMRPHLSGGVYVNALDQDEGAQRIKDAYGDNYERLVALKRKYDPTNFFRMNQNIVPTG